MTKKKSTTFNDVGNNERRPPKAKPESALEKVWKVSGRDPKALRRSK